MSLRNYDDLYRHILQPYSAIGKKLWHALDEPGQYY